MTEREPVQSTRMSPGSRSAIAPAASTSPMTRSTVPVARVSISSLRVRSMVFSGTNPFVHASSRARRSGASVRR